MTQTFIGDTLTALNWLDAGQYKPISGYVSSTCNYVSSTGGALSGGLRLQATAVPLHASDDDIANTATVADLLRTYPSAPKRALTLHPQEHGLRRLGHIDWFRPSHQAVWPLIGHKPAVMLAS